MKLLQISVNQIVPPLPSRLYQSSQKNKDNLSIHITKNKISGRIDTNINQLVEIINTPSLKNAHPSTSKCQIAKPRTIHKQMSVRLFLKITNQATNLNLNSIKNHMQSWNDLRFHSPTNLMIRWVPRSLNMSAYIAAN